jgi:preprotein translocase SecE subunit
VEWPTVGGALSTTAVVIGIVVGSTFVLLSVNSVLSALSQKLFG